MSGEYITREGPTLQTELEDRLRFEMLIADLSAGFVNLPADRVDQEILGMQRRICECLGFDLAALWQWLAAIPGKLYLSHLYRAEEGPPVPELMEADTFFPWCQQELLGGRMIRVTCMDNLPPEAVRDQEMWRFSGVKSSLTFPCPWGAIRSAVP